LDHGIEAKIGGKRILLGYIKLMKDREVSRIGIDQKVEALFEQGKPLLFMAIDGNPAGIIAVADTLKENSKEAVEALHNMETEVVMITGDNARTAEAIARQIGIDRVLSEVLPEVKADEVKKLQTEGNPDQR
jgi:Cu+-exporting ATPase